MARNPDVVCASPGPGGAFQALAGAIASWRTMRNAELQRQIKQVRAYCLCVCVTVCVTVWVCVSGGLKRHPCATVCEEAV